MNGQLNTSEAKQVGLVPATKFDRCHLALPFPSAKDRQAIASELQQLLPNVTINHSEFYTLGVCNVILPKERSPWQKSALDMLVTDIISALYPRKH